MAACSLVNEKSFYEDTTSKVFELVREVGEADPKWVVKLAVFLREELRMRSVVHYIAAVCLTDPRVAGVEVAVHKPQAPVAGEFVHIVVQIRRDRR